MLLNVEPATAEVADELGIAEGQEVLHLERLRLADDEPLAVLRNWLPSNVISPTDEELEAGGRYQLVREAGTHVQIARQRIEARGATTQEARLLGRRKNDAALTMQRTAYADSGVAVELGDHCYRPESYSFEVTLVER